jgi:hypothetical protein
MRQVWAFSRHGKSTRALQALLIESASTVPSKTSLFSSSSLGRHKTKRCSPQAVFTSFVKRIR